MTISERITALCKFYGVPVYKVEKECGLSQGYIKGANHPTVEKAAKIAQYFNMSIEELCGLSATKKATASDAEAHGELIALYNGLDDESKEMCLDIIRTIFKYKGTK